MPSQQDHADMFARRLPEGDCWPGNTDGSWKWDDLITALCGEPARVDDDGLAFIESYFPDTAVDFLSDWERILSLSRGSFTTAERQQQIIAKLNARGYVDRPTIEQVLRQRRDDPNLLLLHKLHHMLAAGFATGQPCCGLQWNATWTCEYMPNVLDAAPDVGWSGTNVTNNFAGSPVTLDQTATKYVFGSSGFDLFVESDLNDTADEDTIHLELWMRSAGSSSDVQLKFADRAGGLSTALDVHLTGCWARVFYRAGLGTGATQPKALITGASTTIYTSYAMAGRVDAVFEAYARSLPPLNTTGEFAVIGQNP